MASTNKTPMLAGTLQTDPRSGGLKRSSGVNVLPVVAESEFDSRTLAASLHPVPLRSSDGVYKSSDTLRSVPSSDTYLTPFDASFSSFSFFRNPRIPLLAWSEVRDNGNSDVDWLIAGYEGSSKTDITVIAKGSGGVAACAAALPDSEPVYGGARLKSGRFMSFYYAPDAASVMKKGRASMHKNGVLNVLEGCDGEMKMSPDLASSDM